MIDALIWTHPELTRRYELLVERCWAKGWDIGVTSSTRTEETQRQWYALWLQGLWPNLVADPDRYYCQAPDELGGWTAKGSMHMIQADGWSHALDLYWWGPSATQFRLEAFECGLRAVESTENWHYQFWDVSREVFPCHDEGEDMPSAKEIAEAILDEPVQVHDYDTGQTLTIPLRQAEGWRNDELSQIRHHLLGQPMK
jgi:hypothetical protein